MNGIKKVSEWVNKNLPYLVLLISAIGFLVPGSLTWASAKTTLLLQIIMFGMGLTLSASDFIMVFKKPWQVLFVEIIQFGWMPLAAFLLTKLFGLEAGIAVGVILVGCCPGGTASNVMTYIAGGDVPLSVTCTSVSTILAPFLTPVLVKLYAGSIVNVPLYTMFISIVKVVLIPIVGGIVLNALLHKYLENVKVILPPISAIAVLLVLGGTVAVNHDNIISSGLLIFVVCLLHNASGLAVGHFLAGVLKMGKPQQRACAIEIGMQNAGLASSLALANFEPISALAGAAFGIWHNFTGALYARLCTGADAKAAKENPNEKADT